MNFVSNAAILALCLSLTACANTAYVSPTSGPTAQFTVPGKTNVAVALFQDEKECRNRFWLTGKNYSNHSKEPITRNIPANQTVSLYLYSSGVSRQCEAVVSFKPKANQSYILSSAWKPKGLMSSLGYNDLGHCTYSIKNTASQEDIGVLERKYERPVFSKQQCTDALPTGSSEVGEVKTVTVPMNYRK